MTIFNRIRQFFNPSNKGHISFFYDESQNSGIVKIRENGKCNLLSDGVDDAFIGTFLGYRTSSLDPIRKEYLEFENSVCKALNIPVDREIKSDIFNSNQFLHGIASMDMVHKKLFAEYLGILVRNDPHMVVFFLSKHEALARKIFDSKSIPTDHSYWFYSNMGRYLDRYCDPDIYRILRSDRTPESDEIRTFISDDIDRLCGESNGIPGSEDFVRILGYLKIVVMDKGVKVHPVKEVKPPLEMVFASLRFYMNKERIKKGQIFLYVDANKDMYPDDVVQIDDHKLLDSKDDPLLRSTDMLAGIISRMMYSFDNVLRRQTRSESDFHDHPFNFDPAWFDIDDLDFDIYQALYGLLRKDGPHNISSGAYADHSIMFLSFLEYVYKYRDYKSYLRASPSEHALRCGALQIRNLEYRNKHSYEMIWTHEFDDRVGKPKPQSYQQIELMVRRRQKCDRP